MTEIVLVRHAQPLWEPGGRAVDDPVLTDLGRLQAERAADLLSQEVFDRMVTSPLIRALETAAPIAAKLGLEAEVQDWLREIGLPPLEGLPSEAVQRFFEEARGRDLERWWDGPPRGETFRHFQERVTGGIEGLLVGEHRLQVHAEGPHRLWRLPEETGRILLVTHAGTTAVILSYLLGVPQVPWAAERFLLGWAGLARVRPMRVANGVVWSLVAFNERQHLSDLPDPAG